MPYDIAPRLLPKDVPPPCSQDVEAILEVDRLFWLDPKNKARKQFERRLVPGEERPYQLPTGNDRRGNPLVAVIVQRWGRTFISGGKPVLLIVDNPPKKETYQKKKKVERDHGTKNALAQFRRFMGEQNKQLPVRSMARKPSSEERETQRVRDKQRAQERRAAKAAERAAISAAKQGKRKNTGGNTDDSISYAT
jgi:hypothetical protein